MPSLQARRNLGECRGAGVWEGKTMTGMILAIIGSLGFLLLMSVGWSSIEARRDRKRMAESRQNGQVAGDSGTTVPGLTG